MKHLIWIAALLLILSACSKEEAQPVAEEQPVAVEETAPETSVEEAVEDTIDDTQEVVEESAAVEEESEDEAIVLAVADTEVPAREWAFREGTNYTRMVPAQPTVGGADKVEVAELFMYSCPHCFDLEPKINSWAEGLDPGVRFVRIPAMFNQLAAVHAQIYFTHEILARNGILENPQAFHMAVFTEYHRRGNRLTSESAIQKLFERFGVSEEDFNKTWNSFEVNQKLRVAQDLTRRYNIMAVPAVVVNGKYHVPNTRETLDVVDELLAREGIR
jgi:thiol:disulfide interchange protein DsbA